MRFVATVTVFPILLEIFTFFKAFRVNQTQATLRMRDHDTVIKGVRTEEWFDVPEHPYAVRVLLTTGNLQLSLTEIEIIIFTS